MVTTLDNIANVGQREDTGTNDQAVSVVASEEDLNEKKKFISGLITHIRRKNFTIRSETIDHLLQYPDLATDALVIALLSDNPQVRAYAAFALGRSKNDRIVNLLIQATCDTSPDVRCWAAKSLGDIGDRRAIQTLIRVMQEDDEVIRAEAVFALGKLRDPSTIDHLVWISCMDLSEKVRFWAGQSVIKTEELRKNEFLSKSFNLEDLDRVIKDVGFSLPRNLPSEPSTIPRLDTPPVPSSTGTPSITDSLESHPPTQTITPISPETLTAQNNTAPKIPSMPPVIKLVVDTKSVQITNEPYSMADRKRMVINETHRSLTETAPSKRESTIPPPTIGPAPNATSIHNTFPLDDSSFKQNSTTIIHKPPERNNRRRIGTPISHPIDGIVRGTQVSEEMPIPSSKGLIETAFGIISNPKNILHRGIDFIKRGDTNHALQCFDQILENHTRYAEAYYWKAWTLHTLGREEEAIDNYNKALEIAPESKIYLFQKGNSLAHLARFEEAIVCFALALELDPDFAEAYTNISVCYRRLGEYKKAMLCEQEADKARKMYVSRI